MIKEAYVSFEVAKLLKEKGFDSEDCFAFYKKNGEIGFLQTFGYIADYDSETCVIAPTHQMAMAWLREVHNISIEPFVDFGYGDRYWWSADIAYIKKNGLITELSGYKSYEEAVEESLKYCLENLI